MCLDAPGKSGNGLAVFPKNGRTETRKLRKN